MNNLQSNNHRNTINIVPGIANGPTSRGGIGQGVNLGGGLAGYPKTLGRKKIPFLCISERVGYD